MKETRKSHILVLEMVGMDILPLPLHRMEKQDFDTLCVLILKAEISSGVRQVSRAGPDGLRDAIYRGKCTTSRYDWAGSWVFQFKQYQTDLGVARRRAISDFRSESEKITNAYPDTKNYIFLTSVPFSGNKDTGMYDKYQEVKRKLKCDHKLNVDFFDGLELCNCILRNSYLFRIAKNYEGYPQRHHELSARLGMLESRFDIFPYRPKNAEDYLHYLQRLFPHGSPTLSPGCESPYWFSFSAGNYAGAYEHAKTLVEVGARLLDPDKLGPRDMRLACWVHIVASYAAAKIGMHCEAFNILRLIEHKVNHDPELRAWRYYIMSIISGKEERSEFNRYARFSEKLSRKYGFLWLASCVSLRSLHKQSWNAQESGVAVDNMEFEDSIYSVSSISRVACSPEEQSHIDGLRDAYIGLHYTFQEKHRDKARIYVDSAAKSFDEVVDLSEQARLYAEKARLNLMRGESADIVKGNLARAIAMRAQCMDLSRLRYDLKWHSDYYAALSNDYFCSLCSQAALRIHNRLFGGRRVDKRLVAELESYSQRNKVANLDIFRMADDLSTATNVNAAFWIGVLSAEG